MKLLAKWPHKRLGDISNKIGSGSTPRGGDSVYRSEGPAIIRSQNVYNGVFNYEGLARLSEEHADQLMGVTVEAGDVLLNITGDSVARCCQAPESVIPARVNQHVTIIRPNSKMLNPRFLCYYLISPLMQSYLLSIAGSGGTRKALTKAMVEEFQVPCPSLQEQNQVVEIVGAYDDLIQNNRRRMALLEESARLLYQEWFVRLRFPGHEHVRFTNNLPDGWVPAQLGERVSLNYGKALKADTRIEGEFPVYGSSGIVGSHDAALAKGPGIILGRKGNVGSVFWSSKDFYAIDTVYFITAEESNLYLYYALKHMHFISTDVAVPGLNRDLAYSRPFLVPSNTVLRLFLDTVSPIHQQLDKLDEKNQKLRAARDLLLPRLMSGELVV